LDALTVFFGDGTGTFHPSSPTALTNSGEHVEDMLVGDFNGDGKLDLAIKTRQSGFPAGTTQDYSLFGEGTGAFASPQLLTGLGNMNSCRALIGLAATDLNGDGILDLVDVNHVCTFSPFGPQCSEQTQIHLGNGNGTFQSNAAPFRSGGYVKIVDVNGDGIPDLFEGSVAFLGKGDGTFSGAVGVNANRFQSLLNPDVVLGDFHRDGRLDVVGPLDISGRWPAHVRSRSCHADPHGRQFRLYCCVVPGEPNRARKPGDLLQPQH
jgi:hypothetical protein